MTDRARLLTIGAAVPLVLVLLFLAWSMAETLRREAWRECRTLHGAYYCWRILG